MSNCTKPEKEMSSMDKELARLEVATEQLEREMERMSQNLGSVLCAPEPPQSETEDDTPLCELASTCRGITNRVNIQTANLMSVIARCQL